jgi:pSer/pThr/pTyr-binding forkhead associated (FHA) protein
MPDFVLEIVEGPEAGRRIPVTGELVLGRDPGPGVALLQDDLLSRRHVRLTPLEDGLRVEDLDSRNGTFVDGDQVFGPAHLAEGGQLLLGVTVFQLETAPEAASGKTSVRPIPAALTTLRPLPAEGSVAVTAERRVPTLATAEREPDYVPAAVFASDTGNLTALLDAHTKSKARGAPLAIFVLAVLVVILYLALR